MQILRGHATTGRRQKRERPSRFSNFTPQKAKTLSLSSLTQEPYAPVSDNKRRRCAGKREKEKGEEKVLGQRRRGKPGGTQKKQQKRNLTVDGCKQNKETPAKPATAIPERRTSSCANSRVQKKAHFSFPRLGFHVFPFSPREANLCKILPAFFFKRVVIFCVQAPVVRVTRCRQTCRAS